LAHSFLFEIDEVLKKKTKNNFTRWMDDIVIGVDDRREGIEIISAVSDMLKSRGLALNLSKTAIYDNKEARYHFQIDENKYLDSFECLKKSDKDYKKLTTKLKINFKKHFKDQSPKYWDKVAKRYITAFGKAESTGLLTEIEDVYLNYPGLRPNLLIYLSKLGYTKRAAEKIEAILDGINVFDDISLYQICYLITLWEVPLNDHAKEFITRVDAKLLAELFKRKNTSDLYSVLWFKAKYSHPQDLLKFVKKYKNLWQSDSFLRRQVTGVMARLLITNSNEVDDLLKLQVSSGVASTVSLANQIQNFSVLAKLDTKLSFYLFPKSQQRPYPLQKFLVLCSVLNSQMVRTDPLVRDKVLSHVHDPYYRKWLDHQYNIK
jgi:hypothetical protein